MLLRRFSSVIVLSSEVLNVFKKSIIIVKKQYNTSFFNDENLYFSNQFYNKKSEYWKKNSDIF